MDSVPADSDSDSEDNNDSYEQEDGDDSDELKALEIEETHLHSEPEAEKLNLLDDPGLWPAHLSDETRLFLITNHPKQTIDYNFPTDSDDRKFNIQQYKKRLPNGEVISRDWLLYSKKNNTVICYYCVLFNSTGKSALCNEGASDWKHLSIRLKEHENSEGHRKSQIKLLTLKKELIEEKTIDYIQQRQLNAEIQHWREVLKIIIHCIQYLAKHNDAFRGKCSTLFTHGNGKFLGLVEMIAKFDVRMREHLTRIKNKETSDHYLGPAIQNEIISLLAQKVKETIVTNIKTNKYYSVQLDCTRDISHVEQLTFIIRIVELPDIEIKEYFIGFVPIYSRTSGFDLTEILKTQLLQLGIPLQDCRGQCYDNGANMIGKNQGVQARILAENPLAFFVPCTAHTLNLLVGDMASTVPMAITFFGVIQRFYTLFASSSVRWNILKNHLDTTLKPLCETRWECRINAIKPIRYNLKKLMDALIELNETTEDPKLKSESISLFENDINFEFVISIIIWYELLLHVNVVSKSLQNSKTDLSTAVSLLKGLKTYLKTYRDVGFGEAKLEAKKLCEKCDISPEFKQVRTRKRKR